MKGSDGLAQSASAIEIFTRQRPTFDHQFPGASTQEIRLFKHCFPISWSARHVQRYSKMMHQARGSA